MKTSRLTLGLIAITAILSTTLTVVLARDNAFVRADAETSTWYQAGTVLIPSGGLHYSLNGTFTTTPLGEMLGVVATPGTTETEGGTTTAKLKNTTENSIILSEDPYVQIKAGAKRVRTTLGSGSSSITLGSVSAQAADPGGSISDGFYSAVLPYQTFSPGQERALTGGSFSMTATCPLL